MKGFELDKRYARGMKISSYGVIGGLVGFVICLCAVGLHQRWMGFIGATFFITGFALTVVGVGWSWISFF